MGSVAWTAEQDSRYDFLPAHVAARMPQRIVR